jgi:hypothetical protein
VTEDPALVTTEYSTAEDIPLETFKHALLLAVSRLPGEMRSQLGIEVTRQADLLRGLQTAERQHLRKHLDAFARSLEVTPAS